MERVPLVDELLVIDSDSDDDTVAIATPKAPASCGTRMCCRATARYRGKGEALWKSLYETTGDLVAWSDTDIAGLAPAVPYGTLGPLLTEPRIGYVKAYYQRPIVEGGLLQARAAAAASPSSWRGP